MKSDKNTVPEAMVGSRSQLAIVLSKLRTFDSPKQNLEQHPTDSDVAATILWSAFMKGDIAGKKIADLGCGTGILGIGAILLGAEKVIFIDKDNSALRTLRENLKDLELSENYDIIHSPIQDVQKIDADIIIQNPPFGTREEHADRQFLEKATATAPIIYSFHKTSTDKFIRAFARDNKLDITEKFDFSFPLKQTMAQHRKKIQRIEVSCYRLEKDD